MIEVNGLSKTYAKDLILDQLSLKLEKGGVLVILGPSGCGKTTFLRLLAGFERPDEGEIILGNQLASSKSFCLDPAERSLSMVFQDLALWPHMTVFENVVFATGKLKISNKVRIEMTKNALSQISLLDYENSYPSSLSGGEKQRLAIARAIISKPDILLMDEPFNSLDPITKSDVIKIIKTLKDRFNITIIYVTHDFDEVFKLADEIIFMCNGIFSSRLLKQDFAHFDSHDLLNWYKSCLQD